MEYLVDGVKYDVSYRELKDLYIMFTEMDDGDFMKKLSEVMHFACIMCYFKEIPTRICLADNGIIHEIAHFMDGSNEISVKELRELFNDQLKLA